jgi:hypothetical protein
MTLQIVILMHNEWHGRSRIRDSNENPSVLISRMMAVIQFHSARKGQSWPLPKTAIQNDWRAISEMI